MQYDSEYPSTEAGILWNDGENMGIFPSSPGGVPKWGGLPNSIIKDLEIKEITGGYELRMSCLGKGIAVLQIINDPVGVAEQASSNPKSYLSVYPNPVAEKAIIQFNSNHTGIVQLSVYDIQGRDVKEIKHLVLKTGSNILEWDLCDQTGEKVAPGIYFARFSDADQATSVKIVVQ